MTCDGDDHSTSAVPIQYHVEGWLTLAEIRSADDAMRTYAVSRDPLVALPIGLAGEHTITVSVLDTSCDYYLPAFTIALTPEMTAWDLMRILAWRWVSHRVMDDLYFASMFVEPELHIGLYCAECVVLSAEEVDQLPWGD